MDTPLRPMSTGELLDRTFGLYKRHFLLLLGITVPGPGVVLLVIVLSSVVDKLPWTKSPAGSTAAVAIVTLLIVVGSLVLLVGQALAQAATIRAISALHLSGATGIRAAYAGLGRRTLRILGVLVSVSIRVVGGSMLLYLGFAFLAVAIAAGVRYLGSPGEVVAIVIMIAAFVGGLLVGLTLLVRYSYSVQACVIEDIPGKQALKRSAFLAKGSRSRLLTIYVLFWAISSAMWGCLALLASLSEEFIHAPQVISALMTLAFFLTMLLALPLVTVAITLAYYDERVRKEGYDLQLLIAGLEQPEVKAATATVG